MTYIRGTLFDVNIWTETFQLKDKVKNKTISATNHITDLWQRLDGLGSARVTAGDLAEIRGKKLDVSLFPFNNCMLVLLLE